jgi:hypothetical protein
LRQASRLGSTCPATAPFPSDHWTVPDHTQLTGLRVALPKPDCAKQVTDCQDINVLDTLDGFNLQPRLSIPFTGPIDVSSVSSSDVFLVRLHGGDGTGARVVGINQIVWDPASKTLHAESDQFLDQDTTYALVVTDGVRDASGEPIGSDQFRKLLNFGQTRTARSRRIARSCSMPSRRSMPSPAPRLPGLPPRVCSRRSPQRPSWR